MKYFLLSFFLGTSTRVAADLIENRLDGKEVGHNGMDIFYDAQGIIDQTLLNAAIKASIDSSLRIASSIARTMGKFTLGQHKDNFTFDGNDYQVKYGPFSVEFSSNQVNIENIKILRNDGSLSEEEKRLKMVKIFSGEGGCIDSSSFIRWTDMGKIRLLKTKSARNR